jgi:hypothetical protein
VTPWQPARRRSRSRTHGHEGGRHAIRQRHGAEYELQGVTEGGTVIKGDINGSGTVNTQDVTLLKKYLSGIVTLTSTQLDAADVNSTGSVNTIDMTQMRNILRGLLHPSADEIQDFSFHIPILLLLL